MKAMPRAIILCIMLGLLISADGYSQHPAPSAGSAGVYHHPSRDKESWQRLNLLLSSTYLVVASEGMVGADSCLYVASRSLGLSRLPVLAEGIGGYGLCKQSQWIDRQEPGVGVRLLSEATGRQRLRLLLLLGSYYAFQPRSYYRYGDSVRYFLNRAVAESRSLKEEKLGRIALCLLGKMYVQENDSRGDSIYNVLISQCREAGDKETEARAFAYRGRYTAPASATLLGKVADLQKAAGLYHSLGDTEAEINVLTDLGYMFVVTGQLQSANDVFLQALKLADLIHYPYTHYNTEALAMVTLFQGKFGEPLRYIFQTVKVAERSRDSIGWGYFYGRLALLYELEGNQQECLKMAQKSINRFIIDRNPAGYNILFMIVEHMHNNQGRAREALDLALDISGKMGAPSIISDQIFYNSMFSVCYLNLGNLDLAEAYLNRMDSLEAIAETIRGPLRRSRINDRYAVIAFKRKQYRKSRELFNRSLADTLSFDRTLASNLSAYRWLISIDSTLGDDAAAAAHYKQYTRLLDSNFRVTKIRQAEELQVIYETQEKESLITLLNKEASQATLVRNLTFAGIAAVIIIAGLLYRQNRLKQKNNEVITLKNDQLRHLLTDREWLLKEIHHRVKNNLQIVISLLNSQAVYINNEAALSAIQDSKRRVYAMSLIHQKLYQSENIASISMPEYINELVNHVQDSLGAGSQVAFEQDVEPVDLDVSQAIPLGLIINESIVNAVKYAFPGGRRGRVSIGLRHDDADHLLLNISDDGVGLPADFDVTEHHSLGLELIRGLSKQLKGRFTMVNNNGFHITIRFAVISKLISEEVLADV